MRILILGTGAMAKRFGAQLAAPADSVDPAPGRTFGVTLSGSWREAVEAIDREGIRVEAADASWRASVRALPREALPAAAFELVLVLVKSHQTARVAADAAHALAPGGLILTLQNGVGNREQLAAAAAGARVTAGVSSAGATGLGPNRVRFGGPGTTVLGEVPGPARDAARPDAGDPGAARPDAARPDAANPDVVHADVAYPSVTDVARRFRVAGLATEVSDDIERLLWRKLAVNCAINPLTALEGIPNGALLADPALRERMRAAAREVAAVAAARGTDLGLDAAALAEDVARQTAANRSSMLQDLDRGAETEIEAICGAVLREGRRLGLPTPVNAALRRAVLARSGARSSAIVGDAA
ncbi:MAG: 2-dehydropantoate 2-reductase [Caldilineae bacterium]|nr:2-dehydropantoate 2-reductase [Caldilineae bacterium]